AAKSTPDSGPEVQVPHALIALQQQAGNRAVGAMIARTRGNQRTKRGGGGGGKKPGGGGGKKGGEGAAAVNVQNTNAGEKAAATAKPDARASAQAAGRHETAALRMVREIEDLMPELQDLLTKPIVTSNADVRDAIQAALGNVVLERDGARGHAVTAG